MFVFVCVVSSVCFCEVGEQSLCSRGLMILPCPPLHSEAVFWTGAQDRAWGTVLLSSSLSGAPTLTNIITSAWETQRTSVRVLEALDAPLSFLLWGKTNLAGRQACVFALQAWGVTVWGRKSERSDRQHGFEHHTWNGRPGGIGQPARLESGSSDAEEVVQSWADAVSTSPGILVQDGKMLSGMSTFRWRHESFLEKEGMFST